MRDGNKNRDRRCWIYFRGSRRAWDVGLAWEVGGRDSPSSRLVVLPPDVLLREIEHDQLVEQWEEELKRRRAEAAAANHAAAVGVSSNVSGSKSNSNTQRQRRRRGSNRMEDGSPTLAGMSVFAPSRKPWVPDPLSVVERWQSHEDGQIKGGRRKKDAKSKKSARRSLSTAGGSKAARKRSSGSERKAEHRAAVLEDTLVRADAEARGVHAGLSPQQRSTSPSTLIDGPHGRVVDGGSRTDAIATTDEVAGQGGSDGAMSRAASSTSTPLRETSTVMATAVRFIVEAKVLRKLRKGDVFIDYAGI
ncbi:hypothetical protein CF319_g8788 [Tilletia indica]|nr:hypothetical protein CF319_g8788 [Tilletia indica]